MFPQSLLFFSPSNALSLSSQEKCSSSLINLKAFLKVFKIGSSQTRCNLFSCSRQGKCLPFSSSNCSFDFFSLHRAVALLSQNGSLFKLSGSQCFRRELRTKELSRFFFWAAYDLEVLKEGMILCKGNCKHREKISGFSL